MGKNIDLLVDDQVEMVKVLANIREDEDIQKPKKKGHPRKKKIKLED